MLKIALGVALGHVLVALLALFLFSGSASVAKTDYALSQVDEQHEAAKRALAEVKARAAR